MREIGRPLSELPRRERGRHFMERFASLTGFQLHSASVASLPREFLGREVPDPGNLRRVYRNELLPRTHNALCQGEPGPSGEPWTFGRLLAIRGFGIYSLLDLLEVLARHGGGTGEQDERRDPPEPVAPTTPIDYRW